MDSCWVGRIVTDESRLAVDSIVYMIIALPSLGPQSPSPMSFSNPVDLEMAKSNSPSKKVEVMKERKRKLITKGREEAKNHIRSMKGITNREILDDMLFL